MSKNSAILQEQLKKTCQICGARWAAVIGISNGKVLWETSFGINNNDQTVLQSILEEPSIQKWLMGIKGMKTRDIEIGNQPEENTKLYAYKGAVGESFLLVGGGVLDKKFIEFFKVLAMDLSLEAAAISSDRIPRIRQPALGNFPFDPQASMEYMLFSLVDFIPSNSAFLGIRSGNEIIIEAAFNLENITPGTVISIDEYKLIAQVIDDKKGMYIADRRKTRKLETMLEIDNTSKSWMLLPVVIGERAIGLIAHIHNEEEYGSEDLITGENLASHIAGPLEKTMMYHESSQYLRRFAILNDLAVLAGKNFNLEDVIVRVCSMLAQAFDTDYIAIPILDRESKTLRGYSWTEKEEKIIKYSLSSTLEGSVVKTGEPVRINDKAKKTGFTEMKSGVSSKLVVPLRIGKEVNGVIVLESKHINAFSTWDEHLVKILASQVGNIAENIQLNEETLGRTRNLMQVNEIIRGVLGLTKLSDIAERAAELMVDRFGYELLMVMMLDNGMNELVAEGIAGEEAAGFPKGLRYAKHLGVPGEVLQTGESRLINNASASDIYLPIPGWDPGSEICVPLHDGESVFGVINVESQLPEALNQDDILILEALAGALSGVLVSARHYAELQMNLAQLAAVRETALDLGTDLELDTLLKRVVNRVRLLVDAQGAELGLVEQGEKVVKVLISENPWQDYSGYSFPFLSGVTGRVAAMGEPMVVKDFNQWRGNRETEHRAPFTTVAGVPLKLGEEVIGTLVVQDARPNRSFGSKEINVLELISPQIAIFIRNARLIKELESRIEAQRLAESRLVQSAKLAAVGEMAAGVAHELNNPLTTVTGFTELIIDSLSPDSAEYEDLKLVLQEAKRARSVVRQLLDFSRQSEILRSDVDINELMSTVLGLVHHQAQTSGVEIRVRFWDDLPLVRIDRNQIQQVFLNLAYNGIQAMPDGGIMLIQTEVAQKEGKDWVAIKIEDTGKGIEEQDLNLIFEPFYTTKPPGKGTGLGLSVSYGIIADHGGFIDVESKPGQGAMFTIWLPVEIDISIEGEGLHV